MPIQTPDRFMQANNIFSIGVAKTGVTIDPNHRVLPGLTHSAQLFLLFIRQLWLFPPQFSFRTRNRHAFAGAQTYQGFREHFLQKPHYGDVSH